MSCSLDTNIVLRLLLRDVEDQYILAKNLVEGSDGPVAVADIVFIEVEYALINHYGYDRQKASQIMLLFFVNPKINCNKTLLKRVIAEYTKYPALSFTDICLAKYAEINSQTPLYTFDKKLAGQQEYAELLV